MTPMTYEAEYDNNNGRFWRIGKKLHFKHSGQGDTKNPLPVGLDYDLSTLKITFNKDSYRPIQGEVVVNGWSDNVVIQSSKYCNSEIELLKMIANGINELIMLNKKDKWRLP